MANALDVLDDRDVHEYSYTDPPRLFVPLQNVGQGYKLVLLVIQDRAKVIPDGCCTVIASVAEHMPVVSRMDGASLISTLHVEMRVARAMRAAAMNVEAELASALSACNRRTQKHKVKTNQLFWLRNDMYSSRFPPIVTGDNTINGGFSPGLAAQHAQVRRHALLNWPAGVEIVEGVVLPRLVRDECERLRRHHMAARIQRAWRRAISCPDHTVCRARLLTEWGQWQFGPDGQTA